MRILFLHRHGPEKILGGVVEYFLYLPSALKAYGIESIIYSEADKSSNQLIGPTYLSNGMTGYFGPFIKPGLFVSTKKLKPLIELCHTQHIDLIHAQGTYRSGYVAMQIYKHTRIPYVVTSHSDIVTTNSDRMKRPMVQRRCRQILQHAACVTHLTPLMATISHQIYDTREKSVVIGNGIDLSNWHPFLSLPEKNYLLGIGRLEPEKGFHILIDAYAELRKQGIKTSLVIAGTGSTELALQNQAKQLGLNVITHFQDSSHIPEESIIFTGYVKGDAKKRLLTQSQMILFPTQPTAWDEPFGIVQIEAMAAGKPLIASDFTTTRYLQSLGLQSILVKADDPQAWAEQIKQLIKNSSLRKQLGETNLANAKQFDWDIIAKQYRDVYFSLKR